MRFYLAIFLSVLILAGCQSLGSPGYRIDEQATAQAQWKPGEVVAEGLVYLDGLIGLRNYYRKFIGITDKGYAVVQDFYADSDNKFTDPYVVMQPERIADIGFPINELYKTSLSWLDGELNCWHENGQKWYEGHYQDGKRQGIFTEWYENGQKLEEGHYQDGNRQGLWTWWYGNGQKLMEGYFQDDWKQGLWTEWDENGQKWQEGNYQNGKQHGLWTQWDENGKKIRETLYEAGEVVNDTNF